MKRLFLLPLLALLLVGCGLLRSKQELESEKNDLSGGGGDVIKFLTLNNEDVGSRGYSNIGNPDIEQLQTRLTEIKKQREENGVYTPNSNEIYAFVYLVAPKTTTTGDFAKLAGFISASGCKVVVPVREYSKDDISPAKPNPLLLVVSVNHERLPEDVELDIEKYSALPTFEWVEDRRDLKFFRLNYNSVEIGSDGKYYLNHGQELDYAKDQFAQDVKQQVIDEASLESEIKKIVGRSGTAPQLRVLSYAGAKYGTLWRILEIADRLGVSADVRVRSSRFSESNKDSEY